MEYAIDYGELKSIEAAYRVAPAIVREELERAVTEADLLTFRELSENAPVGAGGAAGLKGSLFHEERVDGPQFTGFVGTSIAHAVPVELGTRPHFPPVEALIDWVRAKLGVTTEKEARGVAFLIARKISRRGTEGKFFIKETFDAVAAQVARIFDEAAARITVRIAEAG